MKIQISAVIALSACVTAAMLAGCGGSQPPIGAPGAMPQTSAIGAHVESDGSWMLPEASSEDLLYVTNYWNVLVFSYPQGKQVGELKSFYSAVGECIDRKGDVFIVNYKPVTVYEYAHGGTRRIGTFPTKKAGTIGCAINPVNGDMAVTGQTSYVEIFKGAAGKPIVLRDKNMFFGTFCTYDDKGDLFFSGFKDPQDDLQLSELFSGSTRFTSITPSARYEPDSGIQWNGHYLTALSYTPWPKGEAKIFRYAIKGSEAIKSSQTPLGTPARTVLQYFIDRNAVVTPNIYDASQERHSNVLFYEYPKGGRPSLTLTTKKLTDARGVVVSPAQ